jgi:hypothetical protein
MNFLKSLFSKIGLPLIALSLFSVAIYFSSPLLYRYFGALIGGGVIIINPSSAPVVGTAYGENTGYIFFLPAQLIGATKFPRILTSDTTITMTGWAVSQSVGWISLNCANTSSCAQVDYKVSINSRGHLSGYAYGEDIGYIDFNPFAEGIDYGVKIDENGNFSGWAYGESVGWISFNCANTNSCAANGGFDYKVASTAKYKDFKPTTIEIVTQPVAGGCSGNLAVSPAISVKDQWGDYIEDGTTVTASISGGTGQLLGTTTAQTVDGVATFANLSYSEPDQTFSISFSAGE